MPSAWEQALAARTSFEASGTKTRAGYTRVMDAFRAIYHDNPGSMHAPDAVFNVAELLAEQGEDLHDSKSSVAAIGQYEFLRTQYPTNPLRAEALLAEAQIERDDLRDAGAAKEKLQELIKESPRSEAGRTARAELEARGTKQEAKESSAVAEPTHRDVAAMNGARVGVGLVERSPAQVTGIRHWSTATYTRVAIDLGDEVTFEAARVPHPDRIFFDLHGARLGAELVGKSFDVNDDGFLKRIRAAQAGPDVTRVVLDVSDVTEYSAFLLPNPYRLIIDIHGTGHRGEARGQEPAHRAADRVTDVAEIPVAAAAVRQASAAANHSGLPAMALTDGGEMVRSADRIEPPRKDTSPAPRTGVMARATAALPVPNTVAVKAPATTAEVADVSSAPGKVEATRQPSTRPFAAVVKDQPADAISRTQPPALSARASANRTAPATRDALPAKAADKTAEGETSLIRALGLKIGRIVIDAGHGGHDSGTLGVDGIEEKDVVLDVALRLGKLLHERLGAEIIYTRSDDTFIPLETRTAMANKAQADLFLSIHANSSQDESARGVETYYLNFTSDPNALDVAARENAVSGSSVHQLSDLVKKIALKDKIAESREFAADVESSLYAGLEKGNAGLKNRGVKKAPFVVLIGANMPSILAEISFVTNGRDAAQLREPEYRERVAESLYAGVAKYEAGLAGAKPAPVVRAAVK